VPAFAFPDLLEDLFRPVARDGAGLIEVDVRLQKALAALARIEPEAGTDCRAIADDALVRAQAALASDADRDLLVAVHGAAWA
jgi:uncharacterized membrane protein